MGTEAELEAKIKSLRHKELLKLYDAIERGDTPGWAPGKALEYLVLRAFELEGADVQYPFSVPPEGEPIEQIDGVIYAEGLCCLVETKDRAEPSNFEPISKMRSQLLRRPSACIGLMFSRAGFTEAAVLLAQFLAPQAILLWDGGEIRLALERRMFRPGLVAKYRHCVEHARPNYNIEFINKEAK
jgi:hypothetical protein